MNAPVTLTAHSAASASAVTDVEPAVAAGDAGVVDQHVEPAEALVDRCEHRDHLGLVAHVGAMHETSRDQLADASAATSLGRVVRWRRS